MVAHLGVCRPGVHGRVVPDGDLFFFSERRKVINRGRTAVLTKHRIALSSLSVPLGLPRLAFCFEQLLIQSVPHSRPHSRTGPKPCWMRDDDESTRVNWIRKRFLLLNRRHRYLTVLFATAPCDVALEFRSETALFFPTPRSVASRSFTTTQRSLPPTSAHPLFIGPAPAQMKSVILLSRT